ncbi:MAG: DUF5777 family beta-barrel protein [Bacteroidales bacterium]
MSTLKIIPVLLLCCIIPVSAQETEIGQEAQIVHSTFLGTRVVNGQSTELPGTGELNFMINHRFGLLKDGLYTFFGLDQADIRLGFDYGINENIAAGIGRNSYQKTYDLSLKAHLLRQKSSGMPLSATGFVSGYYNTLQNYFPVEQENFLNRQSYVVQLNIARKFSEIISLMAGGVWIHENYNLSASAAKDYVAMVASSRIRVFKRVHLLAEYYAVSNKNPGAYNPFSIGVDLDTGGHLFQLMVSNTQVTFEKGLMTDTFGNWGNGEIYFGFNLIRVFYLK